MEFLDLKTQQKRIRKPLEKRINKILDHGAYIMGPEVFELEEKLADYCGVKHAISCSSGTDALLIPLMGLGCRSRRCSIYNTIYLCCNCRSHFYPRRHTSFCRCLQINF